MAEIGGTSEVNGSVVYWHRPDGWSGIVPDVAGEPPVDPPTPTPTPEPTQAPVTAAAVSQPAPIQQTRDTVRSEEPVRKYGLLTRDEVIGVLTEGEWESWLIGEALSVSFCESGYTDPVTGVKYWNPNAVGDGGRSVGLFQLNKATWFRYAGTDAGQWNVPVVNAITARATYQYDIDRGYERWHQWSCKP